MLIIDRPILARRIDVVASWIVVAIVAAVVVVVG